MIPPLEAEAFTIGELAEQLGLTTRTIRYYEERGLLTPQRTAGNQRTYGRKERGRLKLILRTKGLGLDLEEVRDVLAIYDTHPNQYGEEQQRQKLRDMLTRRLTQIDQQLADLHSLRETLQTYLSG